MRTFALTIAMLLAAGATAFAAPPVKEVESAKGKVLAGENGMTLYTYKDDHGGMSTCYDKCAKNWPPLMVKKDDEAPKDKWSHVTRDDGSMQWAYDGKPLYTFVKDKKAGETTGDGMKDVWHVAKP